MDRLPNVFDANHTAPLPSDIAAHAPLRVRNHGDVEAQRDRNVGDDELGAADIDDLTLSRLSVFRNPGQVAASAPDMIADALEGKLLVPQISANVRRYITAYHRQHDHFRTLSLDAPIAGTNMTYVDQLVAPDVDWS